MEATTAEQIRATVREAYGAVAAQKQHGGCCGGGGSSSCCGPTGSSSTRLGYTDADLAAVPDGADLGLGCGNPQAIAGLQPGERVLDLGSGGGFDAFLAARQVGPTGHVVGVDMTPEMIALARGNAAKLNYQNVEFRLGEIEHLPFERDAIDVVISNCVLNLVPDKARAFAEIYRVLRPGAHFCVSDVVASAPLPDAVRNVAALYVGCIAGAEAEEQYLAIIRTAGFTDARIAKSHRVDVPDSALAGMLPADALAAARKADLHIKSVTVIGVKPPN